MIKLEKRKKGVVISLLFIVLILTCYVRLAVSADAESNSVFDQKSVSTWSSDFTKFDAMKTDDMNNVWEKAKKEDKLKFLDSYIKDTKSNPQKLQIEGLDSSNLKFSKSGDQMTIGDGNANVNLKNIPSSLGKLSYSETTAQDLKTTSLQAGNKFTFDMNDGSKVSLQQGELSKLDLKNSGSFAAYNQLHFKDNNGQQANIFTNGKYSDVEINPNGKITFLGNSAIQTGDSDDIRSTISKPVGPTQDASVQMIDDNHIQISKAATETWRGTIKGGFDPTVTDVIFGNQQTDSKQFVQMTDHELTMTGKGIQMVLNNQVPKGAELQTITGNGNGLTANLYGVPITFNGKETNTPTTFNIPSGEGQNKIQNEIISSSNIKLINSQNSEEPLYIGNPSSVGTKYGLVIGENMGWIRLSNDQSQAISNSPRLSARAGASILVVPQLNNIKSQNEYKSPSQFWGEFIGNELKKDF